MNRKVLITASLALIVLLILLFAIGNTKRDTQGKKGAQRANSLYQAARSQSAKGDLQQAKKLYQQLIRQFPNDDKVADAWYNLGQIYEGENLWEKARDAYSRIIAESPNFKKISDAEKRLWNSNIKILFSPVRSKDDIMYKVEPGDTLGKIAAKHNTTVDLIMRSNDLEKDLIRPGKRLKITPYKYSVIVDKSQSSLALKADEKIFKVYSIATGKYNSTPTGTFTILEKLVNPDWYKRGAGIIPANDPKNILGTRWLGLSEPQYGIHGGAKKQDLGQQLTDGCIRMTNSEIEELFTILPRGTEVKIVD